MSEHKVPRLAKDIMTRDVVVVTEDQAVAHVEEAMKVFRFRHMPVVDGDRLIGMVSLRDALRFSASSIIPDRKEQNRFLDEHFRVRDLMTTELHTLAPDTPLEAVSALMQKHKVSCVPIVDDGNILAGLITEADFVRLAVHLLGLMP